MWKSPDSISSSFFLFLIVPAAFSMNFRLPAIGPHDTNRSINVTGNVSISKEGIQVTPDKTWMTGRATYVKPLHLWDRASGSLTDFSSNFSFIIDSDGSRSYADGLAFFLAPAGSDILPGSGGGGLGYGSYPSLNSSAESFVAVEFDTFQNHQWYDPLYTHVGININSMKSVETARWPNNITLGVETYAWITYNAKSRTLRVEFTAFSNNRTIRDGLSHVVDLPDYLPEYVTFGISAATGKFSQKNNVKSWNFSSTLDLDERSPKEPITSPEPRPGGVVIDGKGGNNRWRLIVGLSVGLSTLLLAFSFASYCLRRKTLRK